MECFLQVEVADAAVTVALNDVPLVEEASNAGTRAQVELGAWLAPSGNQLSLLVHDPAYYREGSVRLRVFLPVEAEHAVAVGRVLLQHSWPEPEEEREFPHLVHWDLDPLLPGVPSAALWSEAEPLTSLSAEDRRAILGLVRRLQERMLDGDVAGTLDLLGYRLEDIARSTDRDPDRMRSSSREVLAAEFRQTPLWADPMEPADLQMTIVGQRRLVRVTRADGGPAVVIRQPESSLELEIYCARIGGSWLIAR